MDLIGWHTLYKEHEGQTSCFIEYKKTEGQIEQATRMWFSYFQVDNVDHRAKVRSHLESLVPNQIDPALLSVEYQPETEEMGYAIHEGKHRTTYSEKQLNFLNKIFDEGMKNPGMKLNYAEVHKKMRIYTVDGVKVFGKLKKNYFPESLTASNWQLLFTEPHEYIDEYTIKRLYSAYIAAVKKGKRTVPPSAEEEEEVQRDLENLDNYVNANEVLTAIESEENKVVCDYHPMITNKIPFCDIGCDWKYKGGEGHLEIENYRKGDLISALEERSIDLPEKCTRRKMAKLIFDFVALNCPDDCVSAVQRPAPTEDYDE